MGIQKKQMKKVLDNWKQRRLTHRHRMNKRIKPKPYGVNFKENLKGKILHVEAFSLRHQEEVGFIPLYFYKEHIGRMGFYKKFLRESENVIATGKIICRNYASDDKVHYFEVLSTVGVVFVHSECVSILKD